MKVKYEPLENLERYEIDIAPNEFVNQRNNHRQIIKDAEVVIKKAKAELNKLEYSSFTHQSYMRARKYFPNSF